MQPADDTFSVPERPEVRRAPSAGRVLCLAPHPDDEALGPGGTLCLHRRQGDPVRVVVATDGVAGDPDGRFDPSTYGARRREESRRAMGLLGVDDLVFWGLPDSCVITDGDVSMVADRIAEQLADYAPDVVYGPWEGEANSDHRALYCSLVRALKRAPFAGTALGYEVWNAMIPDLIVDVTGVMEEKERAIRCYATQLSYTDILRPTVGLNAQRSLIFNNGEGFGEAFRRIR